MVENFETKDEIYRSVRNKLCNIDQIVPKTMQADFEDGSAAASATITPGTFLTL